MCDFFSFISNGKGKVFYFNAEQRQNKEFIKEIKGYEDEKSFDSHSVIAEFYKENFKYPACDNCNKYEYDILKKELKNDQINLMDDSNVVMGNINEKELLELIIWKFKNCNSGNMNSGNRNNGDRNSGNRNSGNWNSGNRNSGNWNSGNWNSGNRNSGNWNSGNWNSGNRNSGDWNSGNMNSGFFNNKTPKEIEVFGKLIKREIWDNCKKPNFIYFDLTEWIKWENMNTEERNKYPEAEHITGGYLKKKEYKEAWKEAYNKATKEDIKLLKALPNFDADIFEDITGIKIK